MSATFFNLPQQKVYLNAYTGFYMEVLDSVMMSQDKRVDFNTPLKQGMYELETEYGETLDFLYDNSAVKIIVKDFYDSASVEFINSQLNTDWNAYNIFKDQVLKSMEMLKPILRNYDKETEFYNTAKNEYNSLQDKFISFTDSLMTHDNYASKLIKADRFLPLNLDDDLDKQRDYLIVNFFNDVDFNDLSLIPTNVIADKTLDFLSILQTPEHDHDQQIMSLILGIDNVLHRATVNYEMYKYLFQFLIEGFNELGYEDIVDYMSRVPYSEEVDCTEEQYNELLSIVEFNSRVRLGSIAKNIAGTTIFDQDFELYELEDEFTIIYFWSYTCDHCRYTLKHLKNFLDENNNFSLVAVSVKGDLRKIKNLVKKEKIDGYFYHDGLEWDSPVISDYAVTATPTFFLLDKDKKIIYKPFDFKELADFVSLIIKI
ncbi:MAG: redoxin domain-containing protein [Bacteroidales bacterium]|nr:redoxin domain-containing protein [Bacteroidales bacterium]